MVFSPTVCHRHTSTLCVAGWGDSVDGLATGWTIRFEPQWGARHFLFLLPVLTSPGAHPAMFTVGNGPLSWQYSSQGMELITHPNLVLILRISWAIPLLFMCAAIGMLWSDLTFYICVADCSWTQFLCLRPPPKKVNSKEFTKKLFFFLSSSSYREIAKRAQLNVSFQNITLMFF